MFDTKASEVFTRIVTALGEPTGKCYVAAEALYHALGGKAAGLKPCVMRLPGGFNLRDGASLYRATHWYLLDTSRHPYLVLDPTVAQFVEAPEYFPARGCGFLTKRPSKRALILLDRAGFLDPNGGIDVG